MHFCTYAHDVVRVMASLHPPILPLHPSSLGSLEDLYSFDPANLTWTRLAAAAVPRPSARYRHGFTSAGGKLYVHGGFNGGKACCRMNGVGFPICPFAACLLRC